MKLRTPTDRKLILRRASAAAAFVLVFAATWAALDRSEHRPGWLVVEAPAVAVVGQALEIRVTLDKSVEATQINCSLHRTRADRKGGNYLASSGPSRGAVGGGSYSFVFEVPEHKDMAFAFAIVYLSPTGKWQDGTRAVSTKHMPVRRNGGGVERRALKKIRIYHFLTAAESAAAKDAEERPQRRPSAWVHPILGLLLFAAAGFCAARAYQVRLDAGPNASRERLTWLAFAVVLVLSAVLELSGIVGHLAAWGRRLAEEHSLYEFRQPVQKAIMAAVASSSLGLFFLFIRAMRKPGHNRLLWWAGIGLAAYLAVSFISVLSFHAIDVVRGLTWRRVSLIDAARGAGALVAFLAAVLALLQKKVKRLT